MNTTISIIIPTNNAIQGIELCLESIKRQTYDFFNVLVIDSKSNDGTAEVVKSFQGKIGADLYLFSDYDSGVYEAMNKGIMSARGEWVYFIGADDVLYDDNVLAEIESVLRDSNIDILYGDVVFKDNGQRYGGEWSLDKLLFSGNLCQQGVFYRRSIFDKIGKFNTRYPIWADWEFNIRCFRNTNLQTRWIDRIIAIYNNSSGVSANEDPIFSKELPAILLRETDELKQEMAFLKNRWSYRVGTKLFSWLDNLKVK